MYLYIHIPFCKSRCIYCDFAVVLDKYGGHQTYLDALKNEITSRFEGFGINTANKKHHLDSLYLGGGTPSLLPSQWYQELLSALDPYVYWDKDTEFTLEMNPDHVASPPEAYKALGINRVSIGVQSLNDLLLKTLSRSHSSESVRRCVTQFQSAGLENISLDLMLGLPGQSPQDWEATLKAAVSLNPAHISAYGLKVEEGTPLQQLEAVSARYQLPEEEMLGDIYDLTSEFLPSYGFSRYEISNWARADKESTHNLNYWHAGDWLALGLGAHGKWGPHFYENTRDWNRYIQDPVGSSTHQLWDKRDQLETEIMLGLRLKQGISLERLAKKYNIHLETWMKTWQPLLEKYRWGGFLAGHDEGNICLSSKGMAVSTLILSELLAEKNLIATEFSGTLA
ncbi:MAG: radical SAM family heme chaperone HemW [Cyanobacteria bacterium]|nr:radical SAM family heme chaperone HemW [Cyanobacteriota bacterium]